MEGFVLKPGNYYKRIYHDGVEYYYVDKYHNDRDAIVDCITCSLRTSKLDKNTFSMGIHASPNVLVGTKEEYLRVEELVNNSLRLIKELIKCTN